MIFFFFFEETFSTLPGSTMISPPPEMGFMGLGLRLGILELDHQDELPGKRRCFPCTIGLSQLLKSF